MSDIEKMIEMVKDVGVLRGMYDQVCDERDKLKAELEKATKLKELNDWHERWVQSEKEIDKLKAALRQISEHQADSELDGGLVGIAKSALAEFEGEK